MSLIYIFVHNFIIIKKAEKPKKLAALRGLC